MAKAFDLRYPIYSSGRFMRTGKDRVEVADVQVAVALGDAQVRPGDLVVGDDDGIVVIAQGHEERVLQVAREIVEQQDHIIEEVLAGSKIADARAAWLPRAPARGGALRTSSSGSAEGRL